MSWTIMLNWYFLSSHAMIYISVFWQIIWVWLKTAKWKWMETAATNTAATICRVICSINMYVVRVWSCVDVSSKATNARIGCHKNHWFTMIFPIFLIGIAMNWWDFVFYFHAFLMLSFQHMCWVAPKDMGDMRCKPDNHHMSLTFLLKNDWRPKCQKNYTKIISRIPSQLTKFFYWWIHSSPIGSRARKRGPRGGPKRPAW